MPRGYGAAVRALLLESETGPSGLGIAEVDPPQAADGAVLIEVHAAGVGFVDHLICRGEYQIRPPLPFVPGLEVAGVLRSAPEDSGFRPGMRVAAGTAFGGWAELVAAPEFLVMPLPDGTSFDAGAGFVVNFQTAHLALTRRGRLASRSTDSAVSTLTTRIASSTPERAASTGMPSPLASDAASECGPVG